jgi:hypothetical protein
MTPLPLAIVAGDGCALRGELWSGGSARVVLLHDVGPEEDLDRWRPLIPFLLAAELSVLAVDLRGHGASDGDWCEDKAVDDVVSWIRMARAAGAPFVVAIAAGATAEHLLWAADRTELDGVVLLSAMAPEGFSRVPRGAGVPKLFLVGTNDPVSRESTGNLRRASIGMALEVTFPTHEHGTALLRGVWNGHVQEQITGFVRQYRYPSKSGEGGTRATPADALLERLGVDPKGERE